MEEGESSGLTAAGLLPRTANQDSVPGSKMVDGFAQSHGICLFLLLFSSSSSPPPQSELTLSSVSRCDSPIFESHCVQPTQECQSVSFALTSALAISSRLTIQWKRNDDVFDRNAGMFMQTRRGLDSKKLNKTML